MFINVSEKRKYIFFSGLILSILGLIVFISSTILGFYIRIHNYSNGSDIFRLHVDILFILIFISIIIFPTGCLLIIFTSLSKLNNKRKL